MWGSTKCNMIHHIFFVKGKCFLGGKMPFECTTHRHSCKVQELPGWESQSLFHWRTLQERIGFGPRAKKLAPEIGPKSGPAKRTGKIIGYCSSFFPIFPPGPIWGPISCVIFGLDFRLEAQSIVFLKLWDEQEQQECPRATYIQSAST